MSPRAGEIIERIEKIGSLPHIGPLIGPHICQYQREGVHLNEAEGESARAEKQIINRIPVSIFVVNRTNDHKAFDFNLLGVQPCFGIWKFR